MDTTNLDTQPTQTNNHTRSLCSSSGHITNMNTQPTQTHNHTRSRYSSGEDGNIKKAPPEPRGHTHIQDADPELGLQWVGKVLQKRQYCHRILKKKSCLLRHREEGTAGQGGGPDSTAHQMTSDQRRAGRQTRGTWDRDRRRPSRADPGSKVQRGEWMEAGGQRLQGRSSSGQSGKQRCRGLRDPLSAGPGWARGRLEAEEGNEGVGKCRPGHPSTEQGPSLRTPPGEQGHRGQGGRPTSAGHLRL